MAKHEVIWKVLDAFRSGNLDPGREQDMDLVREACRLVRRYRDDASLCLPVDAASLTPGMAVCFDYGRPEANGPWRFGVVVGRRPSGWIVYTLNLKRERRRRGGRERMVPRGPGFRCYLASEMSDTHRVVVPAEWHGHDGR